MGRGLQSEVQRAGDINGWPVLVVGCVTAFAMGAQSALTASQGPFKAFGASTVVQTTNITQFASELTHLALVWAGSRGRGQQLREQRYPPSEWVASRKRLLRLVGTLLGFFVGAVGGAAAMGIGATKWGYWSTPFALAVVATLAADAWAACVLHARAASAAQQLSTAAPAQPATGDAAPAPARADAASEGGRPLAQLP
jgi:hypothetical protein